MAMFATGQENSRLSLVIKLLKSGKCPIILFLGDGIAKSHQTSAYFVKVDEHYGKNITFSKIVEILWFVSF